MTSHEVLQLERQVKQLEREVQQLRGKLRERNQQLATANLRSDTLESQLAARLSPEADEREAKRRRVDVEEDEDNEEELQEQEEEEEELTDDETPTCKRATGKPIKSYENPYAWRDPDAPPYERKLFLWRCFKCCQELQDGWCMLCDLQHDMEAARKANLQESIEGVEDGIDISMESESDYSSEEEDEFELEVKGPSQHALRHKLISLSLSQDDPLLHPDRSLERRSTTPLLEVPPILTPALFGNTTHSLDVFRILLSRGATPQMISLYQLEFTDDEGIVGWADEDIFDAFSGNEMKKGDTWKIYLGRRLSLTPTDVDGSTFLHELLDDVCFSESQYYADPRYEEEDVGDEVLRWETTRVVKGIWQTKPETVVIEATYGTNNNVSFENEPDFRIAGPITAAEPFEDVAEDSDSDSEASSVDWDQVDAHGTAGELYDAHDQSAESSIAGSDWDSNFDSSVEQDDESPLTPEEEPFEGTEEARHSQREASGSGRVKIEDETLEMKLPDALLCGAGFAGCQRGVRALEWTLMKVFSDVEWHKSPG
ncbi:hypothetical protein P7C70_g644, partial [Phenoliferia sp. Uapishka_3]